MQDHHRHQGPHPEDANSKLDKKEQLKRFLAVLLIGGVSLGLVLAAGVALLLNYWGIVKDPGQTYETELHQTNEP